jgi:hypothetical protein
MGDAGLLVCTLAALSCHDISLLDEGDGQVAHQSLRIFVPRKMLWQEVKADNFNELKRQSHTICFMHRFSDNEAHLCHRDFRLSKLSFLTLSFHRGRSNLGFTDNEREVVQTLHSHASEAWLINAHDTLQRLLHVHFDEDHAGAVTAADGTFLFANDGFLRHAATQWPRPVDARLPEPLRTTLISGRSFHDDGTHRYLITKEGPIAYICVSRRRLNNGTGAASC